MIPDDIVRRLAEATVASAGELPSEPGVLIGMLIGFHRNAESVRSRDPEERQDELLRSNNEWRDRAMAADRKHVDTLTTLNRLLQANKAYCMASQGSEERIQTIAALEVAELEAETVLEPYVDAGTITPRLVIDLARASSREKGD